MTFAEFVTLFLGAQDFESLEEWISETGCPACFESVPDEKILPAFEAIWNVKENGINGLKKIESMTTAEFANKYFLPQRTVENWMRRLNDPSEYLLRLLTYVVLKEREII